MPAHQSIVSISLHPADREMKLAGRHVGASLPGREMRRDGHRLIGGIGRVKAHQDCKAVEREPID